MIQRITEFNAESSYHKDACVNDKTNQQDNKGKYGIERRKLKSVRGRALPEKGLHGPNFVDSCNLNSGGPRSVDRWLTWSADKNKLVKPFVVGISLNSV